MLTLTAKLSRELPMPSGQLDLPVDKRPETTGSPYVLCLLVCEPQGEAFVVQVDELQSETRVHGWFREKHANASVPT
jgi:hypothetical protein